MLATLLVDIERRAASAEAAGQIGTRLPPPRPLPGMLPAKPVALEGQPELVRDPRHMDCPPIRWAESPRIVTQGAPCAPNGPDHLGFCVLQPGSPGRSYKPLPASERYRLVSGPMTRPLRCLTRRSLRIPLPRLRCGVLCGCISRRSLFGFALLLSDSDDMSRLPRARAKLTFHQERLARPRCTR